MLQALSFIKMYSTEIIYRNGSIGVAVTLLKNINDLIIGLVILSRQWVRGPTHSGKTLPRHRCYVSSYTFLFLKETFVLRLDDVLPPERADKSLGMRFLGYVE